jgi:hypothetical protein
MSVLFNIADKIIFGSSAVKINSEWDEDTPSPLIERTGNFAQLEASLYSRIQRVLLSDVGVETAVLNDNDSLLLAGTSYRNLTAGAGTGGMTVIGTGFVSGDVGKYILNNTANFFAQIKTFVSATEVECYPPMQTVGSKWRVSTATTTDKLVDSSGDFITKEVAVGDIVALRDLSDFAVITAVDSATELSVDKDIFPSGTNYSIMSAFRQDDSISVGTAVLDGSEGQVMTRIPRYWFRHQFVNDKHEWEVSATPRSGLIPHPAFVRPNGSLRKAIYVASFEGAVDETGFDNNVLTQYNLGTAKLQSVAGLRPVVNGQRSEFRTVSRNRGTGWNQLDWMSNWAVQLLMLVEMESMDSQTALGNGLTNWTSTQRDNFVVNTANRAVIQTGWSLRAGNSAVNVNPGAGIVGGYLSYRGIENQYGQIWKFVDGVNYNDGRVYLSNDPAGFADDIASGGGFFDTGLNQPTANGYIRSIHDSPYGFIVKSSTGGSATTYIPDQYFYNSGWRVARSGGGVDGGDTAGFAALGADFGSSARVTIVGGRVCFRD